MGVVSNGCQNTRDCWCVHRDRVRLLEREHYGTRYLLFIGSVRFAIPTFGQLTAQCYREGDIEQSARKVVKPITLSDLTVPYVKESHDWCEKHCHSH